MTNLYTATQAELQKFRATLSPDDKRVELIVRELARRVGCAS